MAVKLASATFVNETASGWQTVTLSTPVAITANTIYVVSYFSPNGDFVKHHNYFTTNIVNGPLTGLGWTTAISLTGYMYTVPILHFQIIMPMLSTNYWADVIFSSEHQILIPLPCQ
jgi:hypothetical protein